jgi:D-sedoheptulose 7-phosphate isomerase
MVLEELNQHKRTIDSVIEGLVPQIEQGCKMVLDVLQSGGKILIAGNGGSAADAQHIAALARPEDLFIGISTSGNSANILDAFQVARTIKCKTLGLSGRDGGKMNNLCDLNIIVDSDTTARIQEMHILIGHIFCKAVDNVY